MTLKRARGDEIGDQPAASMTGIDMKVLKRIRKFMEDASLVELEIEMKGVKLRLKKAVTAEPLRAPSAAPTPGGSSPAMSAAPGLARSPVAGEAAMVIKTPMVGTFYRAPSPQLPPFVNVGDVVKEGQTVCLIEAMKLMNEIKAERPGKVVKILVENGQPVEFDQPLFELEPAEAA